MSKFVIRCSLTVTIFVALTSWGCQKKSPVATPPVLQPTSAAPRIVPAPPAITPPPPSPFPSVTGSPAAKAEPNTLEEGERNFEAGNYYQAISSFEAFLDSNPKSTQCDRALFYLGFSRALINDMSRAITDFRRVIREFPKSPYRNRAEFMLDLEAQIDRLRSDVKDRDARIKQLSEELQRLKEIDLQRRPSRPPE